MPQVFDAYSFPARVVPVALVLLPPLLLLATGAIAGLRLGIASGAVLSVLGALAGQIGRDRGKGLESGLWEDWGGRPTLRRLRYRDAADPGVVSRLHRRIEDVLGDPIPAQIEEEADPTRTDVRYIEATNRLIGLTRDRDQFGTLFAENVNYGTRRNLLGLKPVGITVASLTIAVVLLLLFVTSGTLADRAARFALPLGAAILALAAWLGFVTRDWVRVPAEAYADRLVESIEILRQNRAVAPEDQ